MVMVDIFVQMVIIIKENLKRVSIKDMVNLFLKTENIMKESLIKEISMVKELFMIKMGKLYNKENGFSENLRNDFYLTNILNLLMKRNKIYIYEL